MLAINNAKTYRIPPELEKLSKKIEIPQNTFMVNQGEELTSVYYLVSGHVTILNLSQDGATNRVVHQNPGDFLGEMEVLTYMDTAIFSAETDCLSVFYKIDRTVFLDYLKKDAEFMFYIATMLAQKLKESSTAICMQVRNDSVGKVILFLIEELKVNLPNKDYHVIKTTRSKIANYCGISERSVNRALKQLADKEFIVLTGGNVKITKIQYHTLVDSEFIYTNTNST